MYLTAVAVLLVLVGHTEVVLQVRGVINVAQFVFGDSLVDQGNNNNLTSLAKANFAPHGIDFTEANDQPTGRFSNGRIISDFLSEYLQMPTILAYNSPNAHGNNLLQGCNFASAGSGVLDDTGNVFIQKLSMTQQFEAFQNVQGELTSLLGSAGAAQLVSNALFSITTGGNDYVNNYLLPGSIRAAQYPQIQDYTDLLIQTFEGELKKIYDLGARKLSISNIGPIGCIPDQISMRSGNGDCVADINQMAISFNGMLQAMLTRLRPQLTGATIVLTDSFGMVTEIIQNSANYGFTEVNVACCGTGRFNGNIPCTIVTTVCSDRNVYLFWDPFHPTDKANSIISQKLLYGPVQDVSPINLSQLIAL